MRDFSFFKMRTIGGRNYIYAKVHEWYGWYELVPSEVPAMVPEPQDPQVGEPPESDESGVRRFEGDGKLCKAK